MSNVCEWGGEDANIVASSNVARRGFLRRQTTTPSSSRRRRRPFLTRTNARLLLRVSLSLSLSTRTSFPPLFSLSGIGCLRPYTRVAKGRKVWRDRRRPLVLTSRVVVVQAVVAIPIDAQKWTASCFRFFRVPFHLCAPKSKRHNRNAFDTCPNTFTIAKPFDVEETSGAKKGKRGGGTFYDHHEQQRDGTTTGKSPRGVVVARGRRAKGTNDDDVFVLDGFHVIAAGHLGWGTPPFSLSLSLSLSRRKRTNGRRDAPSPLTHVCCHRRRTNRCCVFLLSFREKQKQHRTQS